MNVNVEDLSASTPAASASARKTELGSTLKPPESDHDDSKSVQSASTGKHSGRKTERKSHVKHGDKEGEKRRKSRKSRPAAKNPYQEVKNNPEGP